MFALPGADPGFPIGGGANPLEGAPTSDFAKISKKTHEIENIWAVKRAHTQGIPLRSTTGYAFTPEWVSPQLK